MGLKSQTAKTIPDVLEWIETHAHHKAAMMPENAPRDQQFLVLSNYGEQLRIPPELSKAAFKYVQSSPWPFDQRMYRAKPNGIRLLRKAGKMDAILAIQAKRKS